MVIQASQSSEYSQVHLTPKPDGSWRFCIDFRMLNAVSKRMGWPLPNIAQMLNRLGSKKPKIFGIVDLTSGYHQAPLAKESRRFTAFITHMGVYEWCRVAKGLKGAASYFQQEMAVTVLKGIIYQLCELYLDDILIHAQDEASFLDGLRILFGRLRKHKITLNPKKCRFGMTEVEYVGHTVNSEGISFSREKIEKVLNIPLPRCQKQLKSFLGITNYFRDHIREFFNLTLITFTNNTP